MNLCAYRATKPDALRDVDDPVGPENKAWVMAHTAAAVLVMAAWGASAARYVDTRTAWGLLGPAMAAGVPVADLGLTRTGQPRHPLYVQATTMPKQRPR